MIPLKDISNGGAPVILSGGVSTVLPDMDTSLGGVAMFIDSKCKSQSVVWRKTGQVRHGIDRRNYQAYLKAAEIFKKRCGIAVVELFQQCGVLWSGSLLIERLDDLGAPFEGDSNQSHMVYWPRKSFRDIDSVSPLGLWQIARGIKKPDYRTFLDLVFCPVKQVHLF